ncbi:hypothetical protein [Empedobacter falsenii]|uniref:Uncharacterized protein n=1 Tax=Empedobacter falsenii TaxID=343874 RepID=A0AAW7DF59_9FLAO|nr:hypothetical protein [Empedobacter falsenii]MDM1550639.1 hypothetical protein [Empedobacter falsenii]
MKNNKLNTVLSLSNLKISELEDLKKYIDFNLEPRFLYDKFLIFSDERYQIWSHQYIRNLECNVLSYKDFKTIHFKNYNVIDQLKELNIEQIVVECIDNAKSLGYLGSFAKCGVIILNDKEQVIVSVDIKRENYHNE